MNRLSFTLLRKGTELAHVQFIVTNTLNEKTKTLLKIRDFKQLRDEIDKARKQEKEKPYDQLDEKTKLLLSDFKQLQKDIDDALIQLLMNPRSKLDEKTSTLIKIHYFKKFREDVKHAKDEEGTSNDALKEEITLLLSSKDFKELKQDIEDAHQRAKEKPYASLDEDTRMLLEIPAFYEGVWLHLYPWEHSDLFPTPITYHGHIDAVYSVARSKKMEQHDLSILLYKPYAFDKKSLIKYLEDLKRVFELTNSNAPILLSSHNHTVCLRYNVQNKLWEYVDTNDFGQPYTGKSYSQELDCSALADSIFRSFLFENHTHTVFNTMVIATPPQQNAPQIELNKFETLKTKLAEFDKNHPITSEQVKMYDDKQVGLFFLACQYGHLDVVDQLINDKKIKKLIDINKPRNDKVTPLYTACYPLKIV